VVSKRTKPKRQVALVTEAPAPAIRDVTFVGGVLDTSGWHPSSLDAALALSTDAVFACVRLIADGVASASWGEWRGLERLPTSRLIRRPAASMTRRSWTWLVTATMSLYGYCPLRIVGGVDSEGVPWSLVPLRPDLLRNDAGTWRYGSEVVPVDELRFIRRTLFPVNDPLTAGVLRYARATIEGSWAGAEYVSDWWGAGGAPTVVITTDQELTKEQSEAIADRWQERRKLGPSHPAVLGKGAYAKPFGADMLTADAGVSQDRLLASIARYFGVPPALVNAPSMAGSLTYSTTESQSLDLVKYTLTGYSDPIGDAMGELLPGDYLAGRTVRLDLSGLTRAEQLSRYQAWNLALAGGWMTADEVRAQEGLAPLDQVDDIVDALTSSDEPQEVGV
jgi:HK97 family phage portal protein